MQRIFDWLPIVWTARIAVLILLAGASHLLLLLIAPFLRPRNVRKMLQADIPQVRSVGGEFAGTKGEIQFVQTQENHLARLDERVDSLAGKIAHLLKETGDNGPAEQVESPRG